MAAITNALANIVLGKDNFCCLCLQNIDENGISDEESAVHIEDLILLNHAETADMFHILECVLDRNVMDSLIPGGKICKECKATAISSYKFTKMCEENSKNLINSIQSVTDSIQNTIDNGSCFRTLFISLNTDDFTSQQYYDEKASLKTVSAAAKRFNFLLDTKSKTDSDPYKRRLCGMIKYGQSDLRRVRGSNKSLKPKKEQVEFNIPTIPNSDIMLDANGTSNIECKVCLKAFQKIKDLRRHFFKKHYPREIKCPKCPRAFISEEMLQYHDSEYHSNIVCSQCGKHFNNKYTLQKHEINHNIQLVCADCGRVYRSKEAFNKHIADDICMQKMRKSSEQGTYFCNYCNKRYCHKPYLAKHIKFEHENVEGFRCSFCNKKFYTPSGLRTHIVKHTLEKNFECEQCGGKFVSKTSLLYHTRLHTGEKPYHCDFCDRAFLSASRRLDHTRRHHLAPSLECDICHSKFKATGSLLKHKKRHFDPNSRLNRSQFSYKVDLAFPTKPTN